jgi:hypothetical protein
MKKIIFILFLPFIIALGGCDLMKVTSDEKLSGDDFWNNGNAADVEAFTLSMYKYFRDATMINSAFIVNAGDLRCAPVEVYSTSANYRYISDLAINDIRTLMTRYSSTTDWRTYGIIQWDSFYKVIQTANILLEEINKVPDISSQEVEMFRAEAVFMRNMAYFFMVRIFGDVPYYTNAYNSTPLPRANMVTVLSNCLADLQNLLDNDPDAQVLPWTFQNTAKRAVRANRGATINLMMHINLWLVKFDSKNSRQYYNNVIRLGNDIVNNSQGSYTLLDLERSSTIFRGGSVEGLFEIVQNINSKEIFRQYANFSNNVAYTYNTNLTQPILYYKLDFLSKIFPTNENDKRVEQWFDEYIYSADGVKKEIVKFLNTESYTNSDGNAEISSNSGNQVVFRYADAILLYAEALAAIGEDATALTYLNMIRDRAGASAITSSGTTLQDDIYWERVRELIGEGHYYYDLIRTGRIHDKNYSYNVISRSDFNLGAWTWPIHKDAFLNNTYMTYNQYWQ